MNLIETRVDGTIYLIDREKIVYVLLKDTKLEFHTLVGLIYLGFATQEDAYACYQKVMSFLEAKKPGSIRL